MIILYRKYNTKLREGNVDDSSPMSFKLPVKVINKYKGKLAKKSSFKKSLTEEIKKMCEFVEKLSDHSFIIEQVAELEKETNINKRYVVTDVDSLSSQILKDFRGKYDITQSALLWLWVENNGEIIKNATQKMKKENINITENKEKKSPEIKTVPVTKVERGSVAFDEKNEAEKKDVKYIKTNLTNTSSTNVTKIQKLMEIKEYEGPTQEIVVELPESTINNFKLSLPESTSLEKAMQNEVRKLCKVARVAKTKTAIVNYVKRIERYKIEKQSLKISIDPDSMKVLDLFNNNYGISKSGLIWLWLSMDNSEDNLKYNIFKLVD